MGEESVNRVADMGNGKKNALDSAARILVQAGIIDDIFADEGRCFTAGSEPDFQAFVNRLWDANREIYALLQEAPDLKTARANIFVYLEKTERGFFDLQTKLHVLEKANARECIRVFKSIIGPINEKRSDFSALKCLWQLAQKKQDELSSEISVGFLMEFMCLFRGVTGKSNIYIADEREGMSVQSFLEKSGREAAVARTEILDELGSNVRKYLTKYKSGMDEEILARRENNRARILDYFGGTESDWHNHLWQYKNVIRDLKPLADLIELSEEQKEAVAKAVKYEIPFGISPYYLSLIDRDLGSEYDHGVRTQVIPPKNYVDLMAEYRQDREHKFDFMGEHDTSPVDLVTRRYPFVAIIKPYNTCAQICVYCQRNWEIDGCLDAKALAARDSIDEALAWFDDHPNVGDVLITGGDPIVMSDAQLRYILEALAAKKHVYRIRIGTRTPVVLPMRWNESLIELLAEFHQPPRREIAIVTHFEHSAEITPEALQAVQKIRQIGISVYNQEVFNVENSRRFESVKLRLDMKSIGVEPYYTFNMKGKEETSHYMAPIARLLQERKEEARLLPGLDRTDEPVFNVPRLGKNHLRAWQDHRLIMVLANGSRVYEFHPWEKNISQVPHYNYTDLPICDYLEDLAARGEDLSDYRTIWYYY